MIVYGSEIAKELKQELKERIAKLKKRRPELDVILVGDNKASLSYIKSKEKASAAVGITFRLHHLKEDTSQDEVLKLIEKLNGDKEVDAILVQLPLPRHIDSRLILNAIKPDKDVDGLTDYNAGRLSLGEDGFVPCTPLGIMKILEKMDVDITGKRAVVVGRSNLVGLPVARLLLKKDATVTIAHAKSKDLRSITKEADILVVAIGKGRYIDDTYIKAGAYVIDVGIDHVDGKLCGDVDFDKVVDKVKAITPVPKGVGPMTVCMLLENVYKAYLIHEESI